VFNEVFNQQSEPARPANVQDLANAVKTDFAFGRDRGIELWVCWVENAHFDFAVGTFVDVLNGFVTRDIARQAVRPKIIVFNIIEMNDFDFHFVRFALVEKVKAVEIKIVKLCTP